MKGMEWNGNVKGGGRSRKEREKDGGKAADSQLSAIKLRYKYCPPNVVQKPRIGSIVSAFT
jgi:hypothetical protein